jgi:PAS domain S-box-containing protein
LKTELFNLAFERWEVILLSILPAFINFGIFIYVLFAFKKNKMNTSFLFFVLLLGLWQFAEGLMRMSQSVESAKEWFRLSEMLLLFFIPFGILFILHYTNLNKNLRENFVLVLLFLPSIILFLFVEAKFDKFNILSSQTWFWITNPEPTFFTSVILFWVSTGALVMLLLLWLNFKNATGKGRKQEQALLIACGLSLPIIAGLLTEMIFPIFFGWNNIPITASVITIFSITSVISIKKYRIFDYSPRHQWEEIIKSMNEGILIVDNEDRIMYANDTFCKMTEYEFNEIKGKTAHELFLVDEQKKMDIHSVMESRKKNISSQYEIRVRTKTGRIIWFLVSGSAYKDRHGKVIGSIGVQTEITALKETEKALKYNEFRLKNAQAVAHVGSWELNFASGKGSWSEEALRMYGLPVEAKEQTFESWISYIHPEDLEEVKRQIERSQVSLSGSSFKHRIIWKDGTIKHIHSVSKFEFNEKGFPIGLFGICHDITGQKKVEDALVESEERIKIFMNESLLSIYFVDPLTKKILYFNNALSELLGYSPEEFIGLKVYDFINHPVGEVDDRIEEVMRVKKINTCERSWKRKNGEIINVLVSSFYHEKNGVKTVYVAAQDITVSVKAKMQIEFDQRNMDALINSTSDLMWSIDKDMKLITANRSFIEVINAMTGITLNPGDSSLLTGSFPKQILKKWESFYKKALLGETFTIEEYSDIPVESWAEISLYPIMKGNEVVGASCYSRNITKSKLDERERTKITDDLTLRNKDLEQFTYIISHNLRGPVATILGLSTLIQTKNLSKKANNECLAGLEISAKKLDETIVDLNNILRTRSGISEKKRFVELSDIVGDIKESIHNLIDREKVVIKIDFSQIDEIFTIKSYLYSILYNLISNSIKYRKPGEIPVIEIRSLKHNNNVILIFKDNCMGIDLNLHGDKVFGLYKRFHLNVEGKGMGLYMVKTQIETLGGKVSLKSEVDKGTEIILEFEAA